MAFVYQKKVSNAPTDIKRGNHYYSIGFFLPTGAWHEVIQRAQEDTAQSAVNFLNGGDGRAMPQRLE